MRAIALPLIAPARWPISEPATRGSNTTGTLRVATLRGLSRSTARSPAVRPIVSGGVEIGGVQRRGEIVVALHAGAFAGDRRHRQAVARAEIGAVKAVAGHQHHAADAGRGRGAAGFGDARDRERRRSRRACALLRARATVGHFADRADRGRECSRAAAPGSASPANGSSGATRAIATARSASASTPSPLMSLVETTACRLPTRTRRPRSSLSERSDSSTAPSRTSTERDRAHRHRVGRVGAGRARGRDQAFGESR